MLENESNIYQKLIKQWEEDMDFETLVTVLTLSWMAWKIIIFHLSTLVMSCKSLRIEGLFTITVIFS